ncbi:unnamed protein product [Phytophthora lilii]|uniref:Unnamed protein product n=1 Tax=Phytophthora lilii TaxID=2077276 RepID=A0A9W6U1W1_9STRA|nr:unnamed protein product [Phytophthora lilii]
MRRSVTPLFTEAELLDVLTGMDVVLSEDALASEQAFEEFMQSLGSSDDDAKVSVSDSGRSEGAAASPSSSNTQSKRKVGDAAAATTSKPKRKRRKHELDHLRAVAAELEKKLKVLNRSSSDDQPGASHFWKHISNQLMTERQKAVGENARLRQLVREQVKSVRSMQRTLKKTPDLSVSSS